MSRYFSIIVLVAVIALLTVLFFRVMVNFFVPLFLAVLLVVVFRPLHSWMLRKFKGRNALAAMFTTISIFLAVLIPLSLLLMLAISEGRTVVRRMSVDNIVHQVVELRRTLKLEIVAVEELRALETSVEELTSFKVEVDDLSEWNLKLAKCRSDAKLFSQITKLPNEPAIKEKPTTPEILDLSLFRSESPDAAWKRFLFELQSLQQIVGAPARPPQPDIDENIAEESSKNLADNSTANGNPDELSGEPRTEEATPLQQMRIALRAFDDFKSAYCGGATWAWIKPMFNPSAAELKKYSADATTYLKDQLVSLGGATTTLIVKLVLGLVILVVSVYFFLQDGPAMIEALKQMSPISDTHEEELLQEFIRVSRAVVLATLLSAIAQGILAGFGFYFAGLDNVFLLTMLTICTALIPIGGAALVWVPACIWLFLFEGDVARGIALGIYGTFVISLADNFIKPYVLHGHSNLHPLFALLSVLGGVVALGPIGILIGPMIVAFLQTLLLILQRELRTMDSGDSMPAFTPIAETVTNIASPLVPIPIPSKAAVATVSTATPNMHKKKKH